LVFGFISALRPDPLRFDRRAYIPSAFRLDRPDRLGRNSCRGVNLYPRTGRGIDNHGVLWFRSRGNNQGATLSVGSHGQDQARDPDILLPKHIDLHIFIRFALDGMGFPLGPLIGKFPICGSLTID